uniref:Ion transport domain-containing protein n=1 Tax=Hanusia phi TaxID=3032 RepID=A0A7S0EPH8_9CRYP|mmetsp:Transcript_28541/g.64725  ORF Transcript_28541/g.64725 Transcript_28541/m.64725 type:complete len:1100 (+) Transcript_28541:471-3770(+)
MRLVGEARAQYQTDINLLGIAPYAVVEEGEVLLQASGVGFGKAVYNRFQASEPYPEATSKLEKKSLLDRNHSHFILVESLNAEDKAKPWKHRYGEETIFRTRLEMLIKRGPDVPILLVCVQGGPGSVKAVLDAAKQGKSCLLVNGSGRAADLMSDAVKLCLPVGHADHIKRGDFDQRQKAMCEYFERSYGIRYESDAWSLVARVGQEPQHSIEENTSWDRFWKMYDMVVTQPKLIHELFTLANSGKCWIFDLNIEHRKGEFKESMLQCLLAEVEQELQIDVGVGDSNRLRSALERKLDLAIKFQSPSDVSNIIKNAWKDMKLKHYIPELVEDSLISALQASTVSVVEVLLQEVPYLEFLMITVKTLVLAFSDQYTEHDSKQAAQARRSLRLVNSVIPKRKIAKLEEPATSAIREGAQRKKDYQQWPLLDGTHPTDISIFQNIRHRSYPAVEDIISELLEKQQDLEVEFRLHCHPSFTYQLGADGPFADLFLSSILFLKLDLADLIWRYWIPDVNKAEVFWTESINPIVYAITAAFYLRRLSKKERNASKKEHLVSRADAFEGSAVKVYQKAVANERADQSVWGSASAANVRTRIFRGKTLVDLAVMSNSQSFLESCCAGTIVDSFRGDLDTSTSFITIIMGTILFGLPAMPKGWGVYFRHKANEFMCKSPEPAAQRIDQKMWDAFDRLGSFLASPIVIFVANGVEYLVLTSCFTFLIMPGNKHSLQPHEIHYFEYVLLGHYLSTVVREISQLLLEGVVEYFASIWNIMEIGAIVAYVVGFFQHVYCQHHADTCNDVVFNPAMIGYSTPFVSFRFSYCLCLFFTYLRLLQFLLACKNVGVLVWIIFEMLIDILKFELVYFIFLISLAILILGTTLPQALKDTCLVDYEQLDSYNYVTCYSIWWIYRTMLMSWGDFHIEEMTSDASILFFIMAYIVLNIILLNLLIALMSDTYQSLRATSSRLWLLDIYLITKEYSRIDLALPSPLNVFSTAVHLLGFFRQVSKISKDLERMYSSSGGKQSSLIPPGLLDWHLSTLHVGQMIRALMHCKNPFVLTNEQVNDILTLNSLKVVTVQRGEQSRNKLLTSIAIMAEAKQQVCDVG